MNIVRRMSKHVRVINATRNNMWLKLLSSSLHIASLHFPVERVLLKAQNDGSFAQLLFPVIIHRKTKSKVQSFSLEME